MCMQLLMTEFSMTHMDHICAWSEIKVLYDACVCLCFPYLMEVPYWNRIETCKVVSKKIY